MPKKEPLVPTSLEGLVGEFIDSKTVKRDEYGRFIHEDSYEPAWSKDPRTFGSAGAAIPTAEPEKPMVGSMWFNSGKSNTYVYDGSTWVQVGGSASGA